MNVDLPPFKNGEHNSENAPTIDRVITPLTTHTLNLLIDHTRKSSLHTWVTEGQL